MGGGGAQFSWHVRLSHSTQKQAQAVDTVGLSHIWFTACFFQICVTVQRRDVWWFEASSWFLLLVATSNSLSIVWVNYGAAQRRDTQQASNLCRYKVSMTLWTKTELQSLTTDTEICFVLFKGESLIQCAYDVVNPNIIQYSVCILSSVWGDSKKRLVAVPSSIHFNH